MVSAAEIDARCERLEKADRDLLSKSYHGIAARLDRLPVGTWQRRIVVIFGGAIFCDCLDQYVGGGIIAQLLKDGWSTADLNATFISMTMLGYLIGALMSGYLADHFGRRKGLLINILIFCIATFAAAFVPNMEALIAMRFLMGIGLGAALPGSYGALGEFTPPSVRGKYAGYIGLIGNFSPPLGALCTMILLPIVGWRPIFIGIGVLSVIIWVVMWKYMPESPRWLASQGRNDEADAIVTAAEKSFTAKGIELEPINEEIVAERAVDDEVKQLLWSALFRKGAIRRTATMCCALFAMNVAIYTISGWTPSIFVLKGMDVSMSIGITVVMLIGAPVGIWILSMLADKFDRKPALVVTLVATAVCGYLWSLVPVDNIPVIMAVGFVLCALVYYYALLACSVYIGEIFPTELRIRGAGFANAVGRVGAVLSPYWVAALLQSAGVEMVYLVNGGICIVVAIILAIFGVETRNKTLEEINDSIVRED
ncbi:MAG: MFS transporter [Eggerthellaceae bacterium]